MNKYIISISILIILFMIGCSDGVVGQGTGASTNTNADLNIAFAIIDHYRISPRMC